MNLALHLIQEDNNGFKISKCSVFVCSSHCSSIVSYIRKRANEETLLGIILDPLLKPFVNVNVKLDQMANLPKIILKPNLKTKKIIAEKKPSAATWPVKLLWMKPDI